MAVGTSPQGGSPERSTADPAAELVVATYWVGVDAGGDIETRLRDLVGTASTGTWVSLPGETDRVRERHGARVLATRRVSDPGASDTGYLDPSGWVVDIGYPAHNFDGQLPLLLATIAGEAAAQGPLRLMDLALPASFIGAFHGPRLGLAGLRGRLGVPDRPVLVTMMKPALGLSSGESGRVFRELALGGVDAVKDDEVLVAHPWSSIVDRVRAHERAAAEAFEVTGHRTVYFVNVTDRPDRMLANARRAVEAGASGLLVDFVAVGVSALGMLAEEPGFDVPIMGHFAFADAITGSPRGGVAAHLMLGTLPRLAGADLIVYPAPYGSLRIESAVYRHVARTLTGPLDGIAPALPVPGGGLHAGMVPRLVADLGHDFAVGAGGAVHGHPMGALAGAKAIRQAIDAVMAGQPLPEAAARHPELGAALRTWPEL
jgi:ribulose 1,5-bisphosphate carboxylase large subunit-like protein